jgi:lysozyme
MNKPKLKREEFEIILPSLIWDQIREKTNNFSQVYLVGFRGYYQDTMGKPGVNDRGIYDDAMCIVSPDKFLTFNGNTDPSRFRPGVATLVPGVYMYRKGKHGITTHADGGYWALRPATKNEALPVTRDGQEGISQGIAINIHKGGYGTTSSEGCQTIYPDQWLEFRGTVYKLMDDYNQDTIPYVLIDWKQ